jgi:hypothetical protein
MTETYAMNWKWMLKLYILHFLHRLCFKTKMLIVYINVFVIRLLSI